MPRNNEARKSSTEMSKREELKLRRKRQEQRQRLIPIGIIALAVLAIVAIIIFVSGQTNPASSRPSAAGLSMGSASALVKVDEYADFQCPACATFVQQTEPTLVKDYISTNKVLFQFHPFSFLGPESNTAAEAAYCASDQNKFWEFHDTLYNDQHGENKGWFTAARMLTYATNLGLNKDTFKTCLDSGKYKQQVLDDFDTARAKGIDRTPSFIINGQIVYADNLISAINDALKANGQ